MKFKAYAVTNEIDLNKIAVECGIPKKYTWEEPLILYGRILEDIISRKLEVEEKIMVFSFGAVVFINATTESIIKFLNYIKSIKSDIDLVQFDKYSDDYELIIQENSPINFTDQHIVVPKFDIYMPELVATAIAKSVALEKTEEQISKILDDLENMIDRLERANLNVSNKELAKTTSKVIRHEYNIISYIMILDKPDVTWVNSESAQFYDTLSEFFELNDRYEILKKKTDILNSILDNFSSISHTTRGLFVEWLIVWLIVAEVILMIMDLIMR